MNMSGRHKNRTGNTSPESASSAALLPIMGAVFVAFLVIGMECRLLWRRSRPPDWTEKVYKPDILAKHDTLYKERGYKP
jgi:hypothetical protein